MDAAFRGECRMKREFHCAVGHGRGVGYRLVSFLSRLPRWSGSPRARSIIKGHTDDNDSTHCILFHTKFLPPSSIISLIKNFLPFWLNFLTSVYIKPDCILNIYNSEYQSREECGSGPKI